MKRHAKRPLGGSATSLPVLISLSGAVEAPRKGRKKWLTIIKRETGGSLLYKFACYWNRSPCKKLLGERGGRERDLREREK